RTRSRPPVPVDPATDHRTAEDGSTGDDVDVEGRLDLGVQLDRHLVGTGALDRVADLDAAAVELGAAGGLHGLGDVTGGDGAEQATALTRPGGEPDLERLELLGDLLRGADVTDRAGLTRPADRHDLLLAAAGPRDGVSAGKQVVAAVPRLD